MTGLDAIMQANKADKERKRLEQQQAARTRQIEEQRIVDANQYQNNDWQTALNYAKDNTKFGLEKAIEIMLPYANDFKLNGMALNKLGYWYWMLKDYKNAYSWYYSSMYKNDPDGTRNLGVMYYLGQYSLQNKGTALEYFQKACLLGNQAGCDSFNETKKELEKNTKSSESDYIGLAKSYQADKNYVKAVDYYTKAYEKATANKWIIPSLIAEIYFDQNQLNDKSNASKWFEIATIKIESDVVKKNSIGTDDYLDRDYAKFLFKYATCMKDIDGQIAINSFQKSVREKYFEGLLETAKIYQIGNGSIEPDWSQAKIFYEKAAEKKSAPAMFFLGQLYETGGPKLEQSKRDSRKWFKMACKADKNYCK